MNRTISRLTGRGRMLTAAVIACAAIGVPAVALAANAAPSAPATKACTGSDTYVWFALAPDGTAGPIYYPVEFTNVGSALCTLYGYPGVAAIGKSYHQLGKPATKSLSAVHTVTLKPGQTAHALLGIVQTGFLEHCHGATAYGLQVYPPNQKQKQLITSFVFPACTNTAFMQRGPVQPGIGVP